MDIIFPKIIQYESFDLIIEQIKNSDGHIRIVDLSNIDFIFPFGLNMLMHIFDGLKNIDRIILPRKKQITSYLIRMDFFKILLETWTFEDSVMQAIESCDIGKDERNTTLLEITKIKNYNDIFSVLDKIDQKLSVILKTELGYTPDEIRRFTSIIDELCQNISRHSKSHGYVSVQKVPFYKNYQNPLKIGITDVGIGFAKTYNVNEGNELSDKSALKKAILENVSSKGSGGLGIKYIRGYVADFEGELYIRSGTASYFQERTENNINLQSNSTYFKGSQIDVTLPNKFYS